MAPAFRLIDGSFQIIQFPGQSTYLGGYNLHVHNIWHINSDSPLYDPDQCVWEATFELFDTGSTNYVTSEPFTMLFTNEPIETPDGDFDQDGVVDLTDYEAFIECMGGPELRTDPADPDITICEVECAIRFDFDGDLDVDLADFARFQQRFGQQ